MCTGPQGKKVQEVTMPKIFKWYKKRHACIISGIPFEEEKPAKTWKEAYEKKKEKMLVLKEKAGEKKQEYTVKGKEKA